MSPSNAAPRKNRGAEFQTNLFTNDTVCLYDKLRTTSGKVEVDFGAAISAALELVVVSLSGLELCRLE
jgi:hypothetical protein